MEKDVGMPAPKRLKLERNSNSEKKNKPTPKTLPSAQRNAPLTVERMFRLGKPNLDGGGKWILYLDNKYISVNDELTALDEAWIALKKLYFKEKLLFAVEWLIPHLGTSGGVICCHTRDFSDVEEVRSVAFRIRDAVPNYRKNIHYKQANDCYCEGQSLYTFDVEKKFSALYSFDSKDKIKEIHSSTVANASKLGFGNPDWKKGGKWILRLDNIYRGDGDGSTKLERAWTVIKELYDKDKFQAAACSTAISSDGLIYCYTSKKRLVKEIESTAFCIREALPDYTEILEYRMANDRHGKALYKFDAKNELFKWDEFDCKSFFNKKTSTISKVREIPSRETGEKWLSNGPYGGNQNGKWMLFFDKKYRGRDGLTKLDRVWSIVKEKFPENGVFKIICSTAHPENFALFETGCIGFMTFNYEDVKEVKAAALAIRKAVDDYPDDMYYKRATDWHNQGISLYKFSVDKEFFKLNEYDFEKLTSSN